MSLLINMPTRYKLFLGLGTIIALLIAVIMLAERGINNIRKSQEHILNEDYLNSVDLLALSASQAELRVAVLTLTQAPDKAAMEKWENKISEHTKDVDSLVGRILERNRDPELIKKIKKLETIRHAYKDTRENTVLPLIKNGKEKEALALAFGIQLERYDEIRRVTAELAKEALSGAETEFTASEAEADRFTRSFIIIGIIGVMASVIITALLNAAIAKPLKQISGIAEKISAGDLTASLNTSEGRTDEVGMLAYTFGKMTESLKKQTRDITEAVTVLASSSNEIATTTVQLASGTEETAVSVSETTTTVEEVKQTATLSSQKAKHVSDLSQNAVAVTKNGSKLVNETIEGISHIREQMEYIAETIVRLSEHNQAIGEIIAAVDDLAEQSNLLAVNASIEAAKAGEYGKGFIVVAQEIKSLAEQSKQATKQVRSILNDIQKSSTAAVMATEKGTKAVEATVKQSAGTGDAIQELSKAINEASQAVLQIAASNQQQLIGMDQVASAMVNIKQATSQNAASTKQVEITVKNLQEVGQSLKKMVEHYKF